MNYRQKKTSISTRVAKLKQIQCFSSDSPTIRLTDDTNDKMIVEVNT